MSAALAKPPAEVPAEAKEAVSHAKMLSRAFRAVSHAVSPAVVSIETRSTMPAGFNRGLPNGFRGMRGAPQLAPQAPPQVRGQGTGFVVDENGFIATNNHVVRAGQEFLVRFSDGREAPATLVGSDSETDIAVLRVELTDLVPLAFGDSDAAEPGDWVIALGSPFGLNDSVTAGIISAKGRQVGLSPLESYLQTDATINPGNSGGPLVDLDGKVVGINTAIESRSGGSDGIGFAIPSNMAQHVVESIIAGSAPTRGFLGVQMQAIDRELAASFGFDGQGVIVSLVARDSPAEAAGLRVGDIIVSVNGEATPSVPRANRAIKLSAPGAECPIEVVRQGESMKLSATLEDFSARVAAASAPGLGTAAPRQPRLQPGAQPGSPPGARAAAPGQSLGLVPGQGPAPSAAISERLGLEVAGIDAALAKERGIADLLGVIVKSVSRTGAGGRAGLRAGDIVRRVGDESIADAAEFEAVVQRAMADGHSVRLLVERNGESRFVLLRSA